MQSFKNIKKETQQNFPKHSKMQKIQVSILQFTRKSSIKLPPTNWDKNVATMLNQKVRNIISKNNQQHSTNAWNLPKYVTTKTN